jgi:hypothetical protein
LPNYFVNGNSCAIQLFFDKCGERAISIESGIEKLQWAIIELADRLERPACRDCGAGRQEN